MSDSAALERFLNALERSGLLPPATVADVLAAAPERTRRSARRLADHFVRLGKLSHFQATRRRRDCWL